MLKSKVKNHAAFFDSSDLFSFYATWNDANIESFTQTANDKEFQVSSLEFLSKLKNLHEHISTIMDEIYTAGKVDYLSGRLCSIINEKKLNRSKRNIVQGFNRSLQLYFETYNSFIKNGRTIEDFVQYMDGTTASAHTQSINYLNRWQMYDKLFHDRVREKKEK
jgi:hypothetical protein